MNPTFPLTRAEHGFPSPDTWKELMIRMGYPDGNYPLDIQVSLGDMAHAGDAIVAYWCLECVDLSDIDLRRYVTKTIVLPTVTRSARLKDQNVILDAIKSLELWCDGNKVDGCQYYRQSVVPYSYALYAAIWASMVIDPYTAAFFIEAASSSAAATINNSDCEDDDCAERERQRQEIIAAFPPVRI